MAVSLAREGALWDKGVEVVAGIDEVGRGALAGPVCVGVVAVSRVATWPEGLADSKELSPAQRERIAAELQDFGAARSVGSASAHEIDTFGIVGALRLAGARALADIAAAGVEVGAVLLDGKHDWLSEPDFDLFVHSDVAIGRPTPELPDVALPPVTMVIGGDRECVSIAAGSVLAKVARDAVMVAAHDRFPAYGWAENKGYGAPPHMAALRRIGACDWHRRSWNLPPVDAAGGGPGEA